MRSTSRDFNFKLFFFCIEFFFLFFFLLFFDLKISVEKDLNQVKKKYKGNRQFDYCILVYLNLAGRFLRDLINLFSKMPIHIAANLL